MKKGNGDPPSPFLFLIPGPASARRSFELRFLLGHRLAARVVGRLDDRLLLLDEGLHLLLQVAGPALGLLLVVLRKAGDLLSGLLSGDGCVEQGQPRADQPPGQERKKDPEAAVATSSVTSSTLAAPFSACRRMSRTTALDFRRSSAVISNCRIASSKRRSRWSIVLRSRQRVIASTTASAIAAIDKAANNSAWPLKDSP